MSNLTSKEAARELGIGRSRVLQLIRDGILSATRHGRDWLISIHDLDAARTRVTKRGPKPKSQDTLPN